MGAEIQMQAGIGVQLGGGNRWGDYTAMTLDPIDQCTFYYTNEYLKTNGAFNWSTRIASFKFPSCVPATDLWGTVTGTITSAQTGAPISGVRVALSNGYAGDSNASGVYTILVPAGSYTATAADPDRNCLTASPPSATVAPPGGGSVTQNFAMTGTSKLEANGFTINDSLGNNNGIVNRAECVLLNLGVKNNGCARRDRDLRHPHDNDSGRHDCRRKLQLSRHGDRRQRYEHDAVQDFGLGHIRLRHRHRAFAQPHLR